MDAAAANVLAVPPGSVHCPTRVVEAAVTLAGRVWLLAGTHVRLLRSEPGPPPLTSAVARDGRRASFPCDRRREKFGQIDVPTGNEHADDFALGWNVGAAEQRSQCSGAAALKPDA
jgi:hypothetical protein